MQSNTLNKIEQPSREPQVEQSDLPGASARTLTEPDEAATLEFDAALSSSVERKKSGPVKQVQTKGPTAKSSRIHNLTPPTITKRKNQMPDSQSASVENEISRDRLGELLNADLAREYQAIIGYVVYSQVLSGAEYMDIAAQLEIHAKQELDHALILSRQIDYLGKMPTVTPKAVRTSKESKEMLRFDLENENETIRNYRDRVRQCEALGEFAMAEQIRQILVQEQDHQIDLATALGEEVPDLSGPQSRALSKRC
jgi:bacterioferritin